MPNSERKLIEDISKKLNTGKIATAQLSTDDRIIARITDGIYRQPASALRELIANAYDADATEVHIQTDAPRFDRISIRDNGAGLSIESLARLVHHIGGSPKRTHDGVDLGIVSAKDYTLSPGGRRLIGKIGIGLFSVAQLTRHFHIITKQKGNNYRLIAEVILKNYSEEYLAEIRAEADKGDKRAIETGIVRTMSVPAQDTNAHGTEIILSDLRPQTKELLQHAEYWNALDEAKEGSEPQKLKYHIGRLKPATSDQGQGQDTDIIAVHQSVPWSKEDPPESRFQKFYEKILDTIATDSAEPELEKLLDYYMRMLWTLSLSAPIDYIEKHPFDLTKDCDPKLFELEVERGGKANSVQLQRGEMLRKHFGLHAPERGKSLLPFKVIIDDVELRRPLRFRNLPQSLTGKGAVKDPLLFVGTAEPDLSGIATEERGGELSFEAYFLWAPKVVPREHRGVLVRIGDASGTLFDDSFMKYQISEMARLRQITAEIFVRKGLDAALNIDRESFNYAHPHFQYLQKWVHGALKQIANTQKALADLVHKEEGKTFAEQRMQSLNDTVTKELGAQKDEVPEVVFIETKGKGKNAVADGQEDLFRERKKGTLAFDSQAIFGALETPKNESSGKKPPRAKPKKDPKREKAFFEEQIKAVAKILAAYGCLEGMPYAKQQRLLRAIVAVFQPGKF